jgi:hypothetical protein
LSDYIPTESQQVVAHRQRYTGRTKKKKKKTLMMYPSLPVALLLLALHASNASESLLPSTRGGAIATFKHGSNEDLEKHQMYSLPSSGKDDIYTDLEQNTASKKLSSSKSRTPRSSIAGRTVRKSRGKKISPVQNSDSTNVEAEHTQLAAPVVDNAQITLDACGIMQENKLETFIEPMCRPDTGRFALFPIRNHRMWEMYKKHVASFWTVTSFNY